MWNLSMLYGEHEVGRSLTVSVGELRIEVRRLDDGLCEYSRDDFAKLFTCRGTIGIYPLSPIHLPQRVASHVIVKFTKPVAVAPKDSVRVYASMPVEVGVYAGGGGGLIEILSPLPPKYALYGRPEMGVIGRYSVSEPSVSRPSSSPFTAVVPVTIRNSTEHWVDVTRLVIPAARLRLLYGGDMVEAPPVTMTVSSPKTATVLVDERRGSDGMKLGPAPEVRGFGLLANLSFTMEWGL